MPDSSPGVTVTQISVSGERHVGAIIDAVIDAYPRPGDLEERFAALNGQKVTFMRHGENMLGARLITSEQATLFKDGTAWLPKGKRNRGFGVPFSKVLDVVVGYNQESVLAARLKAVRDTFPETEELTKERLVEAALSQLALGREGNQPIGVFGRFQLPGMPVVHDAVWLIYEYAAEDDIADGVLYVRPEAGFSEKGSAYGRDLLRFGGEIIGLPDISFTEAIDMTDWDHERILARVRGVL